MSREITTEKDGEELFLIALYRQYYESLCRYASRFVGEWQQEEDVVQHCFQKLIPMEEKLKQMNEIQLKNYLYMAVRNTSLNCQKRHLRRERQEVNLEDEDICDVPDEKASVEERVIAQMDYDAVGELVQEIPSPYREAFLLEYGYENGVRMSRKEIAELLHIKPDSVKVYISRAKHYLFRLIEKKGGYFCETALKKENLPAGAGGASEKGREQLHETGSWANRGLFNRGEDLFGEGEFSGDLPKGSHAIP